MTLHGDSVWLPVSDDCAWLLLVLMRQGSGDEPGGLETLCMSVFANLSYMTPDGKESSTIVAKEMLSTGVLPCLLRSLRSEGRSKQVRAQRVNQNHKSTIY